MNNLQQWQQRHDISDDAMKELTRIFTDVTECDHNLNGKSESHVQSRVILEASDKNVTLWRNNVGALQDKTGRMIRFGLANDSKRLNDVFKSSDLIGIRPVIITSSMVGATLGQFIAREVKAPQWKWSGKGREVSQLKFLNYVAALGGDACFVKSEGTL